MDTFTTARGGRTGARWLVMDGDDTLWKTTPVYDRAYDRLASLARARGSDPAAVCAWARAHDVKMAGTMGYAMHRFPSSLRDAAVHFWGEGEHAWAALGIGYSVFGEVAAPMDGVEEFLANLPSDLNLALMTAGEVTIQQRRVADFPWRDRFDAVRIVPRKDASAFASLAQDFGMDPGESWVVGDSLRSDVCPATEAGFRAVLFESQNWVDYERAEHALPGGARAVSDFRELAAILDLLPMAAPAP